jgi:hypothetical protein
MTRKALIAILATVALLVGVSTADAGTVRMTTCINGGGSATTTPGDLYLSIGWGTSTSNFTKKFLDVQSVQTTVNGVTTSSAFGDLAGWSAIVFNPDFGLYQTRYTSPAPVATLASGDSVTVALAISTDKKVYDDAKTSFGPGEIFSIPCTITAQ